MSEENVVVVETPESGPDAPTEAAAPAVAERPDNIQEKFWDAEKGEVRVDALAKSYAELEAARSNPDAEDEPAEGSEASEEEAVEETPDENLSEPERLHTEATGYLKEAGLDIAKFNAEFAEKGALSEESYAEITEKANVPRELVNAYIATMGAANAATEAASTADGEAAAVAEEKALENAMAAVGGEENFNELAQWAKVNLSDEDKAAYEGMISAGTGDNLRVAVEWLNAKRVAAEGSEATLLSGKANASAGVKPFASQAELQEAIRDPRYKKGDPAFHAEVDKRLAVSGKLR